MDASTVAALPHRFVSTPSGKIALRTAGWGPPLVFVHGWPFHGLSYRHLAARLATRFTCHLIDMPGAGATEWSSATDFSFMGHARAVRGVADALGLGLYGLIAFDTGATIARLLAAEDNRVCGLLLSNTEMPHHRPPWIPLFRALAALPGRAAVFAAALRSRRFLQSQAGFGGCFVDLTRIDGEFHDLFVAPLIASEHAREGQLRYIRGADWNLVDGLDAVHRRIEVPVKLLWGVDDPTFSWSFARSMEWSFPWFSGLEAIEGGKLLVHEEQADVFAVKTAAFFELTSLFDE